MTPARAVKLAAIAVAALATAPAVLAVRIESRLVRSEQLFRLFAELLAIAPGLPGAYLRAAYYAGTLASASFESHVGFGTVFVVRDASLGRHASLGSYCVIGHARIGAGAMVGSRVSMPSGRRQHLDADGRLSSSEGRFDTVSIGEGCWIGEGAIVMADVGARCVVAAGAVVSTPMPAASVVGGNPARVLKPADAVDGTGRSASSDGSGAA